MNHVITITTVNTADFPEGSTFPWSERVYNEEGELLYEHNPDFTEITQVLFPRTVPEEEGTPSEPQRMPDDPTPEEKPLETARMPEQPKFEEELPRTGLLPATGGGASIALGFAGVLIVGFAVFYYWQANKKEKET